MRALAWLGLLLAFAGVVICIGVQSVMSGAIGHGEALIGLSHIHAPQAPAVAAGLNIAGFNGGIALGSLLGGASLEAMGLISTAWVGAVAVGLGIAWMVWQMRLPAFLGTRVRG